METIPGPAQTEHQSHSEPLGGRRHSAEVNGQNDGFTKGK